MYKKFEDYANRMIVEQFLKFEEGFEQTTLKIAKAAEEQNKLNEKVDEGSKKAEKLANAFQLAKSMYEKGKLVAAMTIVPAAKENELEELFKVRVGDVQVGSAIFKQVKQEALRTGTDVTQSLNNALSFMSMTQNSDQIAELNNFAARLSTLSPGGKSSADAAAAIMNAMRGNTDSLAKDFHIPAEEIAQFNSEIVGAKGNFESFLASMDELLNRTGMTQEGLNTMLDSPVNQWQTLLGNVNNSFIQIGTGALAALTPILQMLNEAFQNGTFQPFIDALSIGLMFISELFLWVTQMVPPAWEIIKGTIIGVGTVIWNLISMFLGLLPILILVGVLIATLNAGFIFGKMAAWGYAASQTLAAIGTNAVAAATKLAAGATRIWNMVLQASPLTRIISLITVAISAFGMWVLATQDLKQVFSNVFGFIVDLAQSTVNAVIGLINGIIKGVNAVAGFFGRILGVDTKEIAEIEYRADFTDFRNKGQDFIENFSMDNFKQQFIPDAGNDFEDILNQHNMGTTGLDVAYSAPSPSPSMPSMPTTPMPVAPMGGSIDTVDKVNKTVDVASEDLKVMRDLAEIQAISNMITLTPTVQMTTGDINSGADLDTIISRINRTLEEEFVSSAEGVYL
ncbi:hypothetical protein CHH67_08445 [Paenibacillus campinasensis]|uniref:Phage tail tape measure protein n=2 Tax=Paenibacillus campinasensis TaxID=66347 RepID=A0A268EY43_9BACL|nr:hypothetical protein CHH67_08445 [Paenibacillus campinasensis]